MVMMPQLPLAEDVDISFGLEYLTIRQTYHTSQPFTLVFPASSPDDLSQISGGVEWGVGFCPGEIGWDSVVWLFTPGLFWFQTTFH